MKRIKNIEQLRAEKRKLQQRQALLELKIQDNWNDVKDTLRPANLVRETFSKVLLSKPVAMIAGNGLLKGALAFGVSLLASKIAEKGAGKLGKLLRNRSLLPK